MIMGIYGLLFSPRFDIVIYNQKNNSTEKVIGINKIKLKRLLFYINHCKTNGLSYRINISYWNSNGVYIRNENFYENSIYEIIKSKSEDRTIVKYLSKIS
jgi:hypothetical protein